MAHPNGRGCVAVATATDVGAADEKSDKSIWQLLNFNVGESRYRSKKTSVPGFLLQMSVLSVSDVIISEERKVIKIWRQNQLVGIRKPPLVDKKKKCNV